MYVKNHPIDQEELMAYLDGELAADRAMVAAAHLEECRECQDLAGDLRGVSVRLMGWQVESSGLRVQNTVATALDKQRPKPNRLALLRQWRWAWGSAVVCILVVVLALPRWSQNYGTEQFFAPPQQARVRPAPEPQPPVGLDKLSATAPMIARTAQLTITTKDLDKARASLEDILKQHKGYLGDLNTSDPTDAAHVLNATLRVPVDQLESVIAELKKLGRVESESQAGEEITQQYVDLEARLANSRNSERRMTDLLRDRTGKLSDVLSVEKEIDRVRGEIEQMEAERKTMRNRVDFATVTVKLTEDYKAGLQLPPGSLLNRFRNAAVEGYTAMVEGAAGAAVFLLSYGPSVLLWAALLFLPVRFLLKRIRRRAAH